MNDADGRYNAKWLDVGSLKSPQNHDLGGVTVGDFRRGQGGIFCRITRPFAAVNVPDLFLESEQKRSLIDLGYHDKMDLKRSEMRYTKADNQSTVSNSGAHLLKSGRTHNNSVKKYKKEKLLYTKEPQDLGIFAATTSGNQDSCQLAFQRIRKK